MNLRKSQIRFGYNKKLNMDIKHFKQYCSNTFQDSITFCKSIEIEN